MAVQRDFRFPDFIGYIFLPIAATLAWFGTLLSLFILWQVKDEGKQYRTDSAWVSYISDVGARHKRYFVAGAGVTGITYGGSLLAERWLRKTDRIPGTINRWADLWDLIAVVIGCIGGVCIILVSILDSVHYGNYHWALAFAFVICISISSIAQTLEIWHLKRDYPDRKHLQRNALIKIWIVSVAVFLAVCFGVSYGVCGGNVEGPPGEDSGCWAITSIAATLEWVIALLYSFYLFTFILDLWPAKMATDRYQRRQDRRAHQTPGLLSGYGTFWQ